LVQKESFVKDGIETLRKQFVDPAEINQVLEKLGSGTISEKERAQQILKRPEIELTTLLELESFKQNGFWRYLKDKSSQKMVREVIEQVEIEIKYEGYIERQRETVVQFEKYEEQTIPPDFNFRKVRALSSEAIDKFSRVKPTSIGQASRISGVTPSDISVLMVYLKG
jgi:tRNA uridine 5-carboxymethylaminomethyl modification enzyme